MANTRLPHHAPQEVDGAGRAMGRAQRSGTSKKGPHEHFTGDESCEGRREAAASLDLVKGWKDVISKLYLDHRSCVVCSHADRIVHNALLRNGSIDHSVGAEFLLQIQSTANEPPECNIFSKAEYLSEVDSALRKAESIA